jgi:anti-sigma B factor antagonist
MAGKLTINKSEESGACVLTLGGRLDTGTAQELANEIISTLEANETGVILDIAGLTYVSSAGLRVFLSGEKKSKAAGKTQIIRGANESVREIFDITGFTSILNLA